MTKEEYELLHEKWEAERIKERRAEFKLNILLLACLGAYFGAMMTAPFAADGNDIIFIVGAIVGAIIMPAIFAGMVKLMTK